MGSPPEIFGKSHAALTLVEQTPFRPTCYAVVNRDEIVSCNQVRPEPLRGSITLVAIHPHYCQRSFPAAPMESLPMITAPAL